MSDIILEMRNVTKRFPGVLALDNVSIELRKGEVHAICGENGAGKSTLMKVLSGSYVSHMYEGEVWFEGKHIHPMNVKTARDLGIEMIYQEINAMLDGNIAENLYVGNLPGKGSFVDYKKLYADTAKVLKSLEIHVDPKSTARPLNSGQLQLLSIMRAVIRNPKVLVFDEPTSALTDNEIAKLFEIIETLKKNGVSCVYISHKLDEIFQIADRVTVMRDGTVVSTKPISECTNEGLVENMVGRKIENMYPSTNQKHSKEVVLKVENLSVPHPTIKDRNIVEDISFELHKGEILGLGGLVGAGRSETLGAIFGQYTRNVKKKIFIDGKEVSINKPSDAIGLGIGFVTEERKKSGYVWLLSVMKNLTLVCLKQLPKRFIIDVKGEREKAKVVFERLKIKAPSLDTRVNNLSGGNQQKVVLGKWLLLNPKILFIDEPTKGIDVGAKAEIYLIMRELTEAGVSIIMASSDLPELVSMSDRVLVISNQKITGELTGDAINQENVMKAAFIKK